MTDFWLTLALAVWLGAMAAILRLLWDVRPKRRPGPDVGLGIFDGEWFESPETAAVRIARSPLARAPSPEELDAAARCGEFAAAITAAFTRLESRLGPGRHRSLVPQDRDPRAVALLTKTCEFDAAFAEMVEQLELPLEAA